MIFETTSCSTVDTFHATINAINYLSIYRLQRNDDVIVGMCVRAIVSCAIYVYVRLHLVLYYEIFTI